MAPKIKPPGIKKGIPLYPNLVNLKSNTMKNTMQRYGFLRKMQCFGYKKVSEIVFFKDLSVILQSVVGKWWISRHPPVSVGNNMCLPAFV